MSNQKREAQVSDPEIAAYLNRNPVPLFLKCTAGKGTADVKRGQHHRKDRIAHELGGAQ